MLRFDFLLAPESLSGLPRLSVDDLQLLSNCLSYIHISAVLHGVLLYSR